MQYQYAIHGRTTSQEAALTVATKRNKTPLYTNNSIYINAVKQRDETAVLDKGKATNLIREYG